MVGGVGQRLDVVEENSSRLLDSLVPQAKDLGAWLEDVETQPHRFVLGFACADPVLGRPHPRTVGAHGSCEGLVWDCEVLAFSLAAPLHESGLDIVRTIPVDFIDARRRDRPRRHLAGDRSANVFHIQDRTGAKVDMREPATMGRLEVHVAARTRASADVAVTMIYDLVTCVLEEFAVC